MSKYFPNSEIERRVSYDKKIANNYQRAIELLDLYDFGHFNSQSDEKRQEKIKINYGLANGVVDTKLYDEGPCLVVGGEEIYDDSLVIEHYPVTAQIIQALYGEALSRPFNLTVQDLSPLKHTYESKELNRLIKEYIDSNVMNPMRQRIQMNYMMQLGITDPFSLQPEEQAQMKADIDKRVEAMNPKEIIEYMKNDFTTPIAKQAQEIMNYHNKKYNMRHLQAEGFKDAAIMAEIYYYVDVHNDQMVFEHVTPKSLSYGGSQETEWVQEMTWAKRERWLTIEDVFDRYGEYFSKKDIDLLDRYVSPIPGGRYNEAVRNKMAHNKAYVYDTSDPQMVEYYENKYGKLDHSKEGRSAIMRVYNEAAKRYGVDTPMSEFGIRETHICYRDLAEYTKVERLEKGKIEKYWFKGHYEPKEGDVSVTKHWFSEVWQGTKLGHHQDAVYVKIEPLKYQHRNLDDPRKTELPYIGRKLFTHKNQTKNVSQVDLAKKYQKEIDMLMASIKHDLKTDLGRQFLFAQSAKPKEYTLSEWFSMMKNYNLTMVDPNKLGMGAQDLQYLFRGHDVSKMAKIAEKIQLVQQFTQDLYRVMYFSPARQGAASQYATNQNIQSQISSSQNQTEPLFEGVRTVFEKAATTLMNKSRLFYKDNPKEVEKILSPTSLMELKVGKPFWYANFAIYLENSGIELRQVELLKNRMLELIQNGMDQETILELALANSKSDIINIVRKSSKELREQQAKAAQAEQERFEKQMAAQMQEKQAEREFKYRLHTETLDSQEDRAALQAQTFMMANDVNKDGEAESTTNTKLKIASEERIEREKRQVEREKMKYQSSKN